MTELPIPPRAGKVPCAPGTMDQPGRNHPGIGVWLCEMVEEHLGLSDHHYDVADPFVGAGYLWLHAGKHVRVHGCEVRPEAAMLARANGIEAEICRAERVDFGREGAGMRIVYRCPWCRVLD